MYYSADLLSYQINSIILTLLQFPSFPLQGYYIKCSLIKLLCYYKSCYCFIIQYILKYINIL